MIQYVTRVKKNPKNDTTAYYAQVAPVTPIGQDDLADYINDQTTVSKTDIKAILVALENAIAHYLIIGHSVRFGNLGSFRPTISSASADTAANVSADKIKSVRVVFSTGSYLRNKLQLQNLTFGQYAIPSDGTGKAITGSGE